MSSELWIALLSFLEAVATLIGIIVKRRSDASKAASRPTSNRIHVKVVNVTRPTYHHKRQRPKKPQPPKQHQQRQNPQKHTQHKSPSSSSRVLPLIGGIFLIIVVAFFVLAILGPASK